jgi:hypothetical protein
MAFFLGLHQTFSQDNVNALLTIVYDIMAIICFVDGGVFSSDIRRQRGAVGGAFHEHFDDVRFDRRRNGDGDV